VVNGASGALFGSGTFGGSVNMCNKPDWNNRLAIVNSFETGSYGSLANVLSFRTGGRNLQLHVAAMAGKAENNFPYTDKYRYDAPSAIAEHNALRTIGLIQNIYANLGKGNYIEAGIWYHFKTKELPALWVLTRRVMLSRKTVLSVVYQLPQNHRQSA
jgi:hypothetical protein